MLRNLENENKCRTANNGGKYHRLKKIKHRSKLNGQYRLRPSRVFMQTIVVYFLTNAMQV